MKNNLDWLKENVYNGSMTCKSKYFNCDDICEVCYVTRYNKKCEGNCFNCDFCHIEDCIFYLLENHEDAIELFQWEYDSLYYFEKRDISFEADEWAKAMKKQGYFEGVKDTSMKIYEILEKCRIKEAKAK